MRLKMGRNYLHIIFKQMVNNAMLTGMESVYYLGTQINPMYDGRLTEQLNDCIKERLVLANELQNEVNQLLTAAQLWITISMKENNLSEDKALHFAETHLKSAIDHLRSLHYSIVKPKSKF